MGIQTRAIEYCQNSMYQAIAEQYTILVNFPTVYHEKKLAKED